MPHDAWTSASTGPASGPPAEERDPATDGVVGTAEVRSVPLEHLLKVAVLTPAQATYVAAQLFLAQAEEPVGVREDGRPSPGQVRVTAEGEVVRSDRTARASAAELQDGLLRSARQLPAHPRPYQRTLLQRLEEQVAGSDRPADRAAALHAALDEALGSRAGSRIRDELAALVEAYGHVAVATSPPPSVEARTAPAALPAELPRPPGHPPPRRGARRRGRTRLVLTGALLLAVVLAAGGYLALREPGAGQADSSDSGAAPSTSAPSAPSGKTKGQGSRSDREPARAPALAPRTAGRIRGVQLEKGDGCRPGSSCLVTVTVRLAPATASQSVGWRVGAVRPCSKRVAWSPATAVTAQPGWTTVYATSPVQVPAGDDLGLVAVTTTPVRAQSPPVPVAGSLRC